MMIFRALRLRAALSTLVVCTSLLAPQQTLAGGKEYGNDLAMWNTIILQVPIGERFQLNTLSQMRNNHNITDADRFLQFADLNYFLDKNKHWSVGVGYAWTPTFGTGFRNENRVYEQIGFSHNIPGGTLVLRNRLAQRFIKDTGGTAQWNRTLVQFTHPFKKYPGWYVTASNEVFIGLESVHNGPTRGFDQNRSYLAVGKALNKHMKLEGGYMLIWLHNPQAGGETLQHTLMTQLTIH